MTDEELDAIAARRGPSTVVRDDDALAEALGHPAWLEQIRKDLREKMPEALSHLAADLDSNSRDGIKKVLSACLPKDGAEK